MTRGRGAQINFSTNVLATCLNQNRTTLFILALAIYSRRQTTATVLQTRVHPTGSACVEILHLENS